MTTRPLAPLRDDAAPAPEGEPGVPAGGVEREGREARPAAGGRVRRARVPGDENETRRLLQRAARRAAVKARAEPPLEVPPGGEVVRPLPRRKMARADAMAPPDMVPPRPPAFQPDPGATFTRTLFWLRGLLLFVLGDLLDRLRGKAGVDRRAARLREIFQRGGATFTRIGQELGTRVDLLPYEYCRELARLRDHAPAMPIAQAVAAVERATGGPLADTFAAFDPEPIGSATFSCVYQAVLRDGTTKVAVKVRRPDVGPRLAADLRALDILAAVAELLGVFRPGYVENVTREVRLSLTEELDLRMESAYQALFRREARRGRLGRRTRVRAPRGFGSLSTSEVIVERFAAGMWLWEILAAVETRDPTGLARMRELGIDRRLLARRLYRAGLWGQLVCPIFHASPAPTNVLVQRGSRLVQIDFRNCGATNRARRSLRRDLLTAQVRRDVQGIARSLLAFLEPLPPIDLDELEKKTEMLVGQVFHRLWSGDARWPEKSSAALYFRFFEIARQYDIPVSLDTVRGFRAAMLYDTLALRVDPTLDIQRENRSFDRQLAEERLRSLRRGLRRRLRAGLVTADDTRMLEEVVDVAARGLKAMRQALDRPQFDFAPMVEKPVFAAVEAVRFLALAAIITALGGAFTWLSLRVFGTPVGPRAAVALAVTSVAYQAGVALVAAVSLRRVMVRLMDMKVRD